MKVNIVIGNVVWEVVSPYCPQASRSVNEKEEFYELMGQVTTRERVLVGSDFNGHVGSNMGGFGELHGSFGFGQIYDGGIRFLDWAVDKRLRLMNICFQKRKSQPITFPSSETETMMDYILVNSKDRSSVKDVKVIPGEEIVSQHCLLLMDMVQKGGQKKSKIQKEIETVDVERIRKEEIAEGLATYVMVTKIGVV